MILEGTNGPFGRITAMDVGWHKLEFNVVVGHICFEALGCFIVHEMHLRLEATCLQVVFMQRLELRLQFTTCSCFEWSHQDGIAIIIVEDHQVLVSLERYGGELACLVGIGTSTWCFEGLCNGEEDGVCALAVGVWG